MVSVELSNGWGWVVGWGNHHASSASSSQTIHLTDSSLEQKERSGLGLLTALSYLVAPVQFCLGLQMLMLLLQSLKKQGDTPGGACLKILQRNNKSNNATGRIGFLALRH